MSQQAPSTSKAANVIVDVSLTSEFEPLGLADKKKDTSLLHQSLQFCKKVDKIVEHTSSLPCKSQDNVGEKDSEKGGEENREKDGEESGENSSTLTKTRISITKKVDSKPNPKPTTFKIVWRLPQLPAPTSQEIPKTKITLSKSFLTNLNKTGSKIVAVNNSILAPQAYTCSTCKRQFVTTQLLEKHKLEDHGAVDKYKCRLCCITYRRKRGLSIHMRREHPGSQKAPNQCALCELAFPDKDSLKKHARAQHELTYTCEYCKRLFTNKTLFNKHTKEMHVKNEDGTITNRGFECRWCKQVFVTLRAHNNHVNAFCKNRMTEEKPFSCPKCDETFWNSLLLKRHYRKVHKEQVDPSKVVASHKCQLCSKTFISPAALKLHTCHRPCRQFKCQLCDKTYKNNTALTEHIEVVHSGKKPEYPCKQCGKVYNRLHNLKYHQREHVKGKKMYKCAFCPKQYTSKQSVGEHERKHRGEPVLCPHCGKSFASMKILSQHEKSVHMNKRNYVCTICSKAYYDSYNLKCHIDSHMGLKNLKCRYCDEKFTYSAARTAHQKTQHPEEHGAFMIKFRERNKVEIIQPGEVGGEKLEAEDEDMAELESGKIDGTEMSDQDFKEIEVNQSHSNSGRDTSRSEINDYAKSEDEIGERFEDAEMPEKEEDSSKDGFLERLGVGMNQNPDNLVRKDMGIHEIKTSEDTEMAEKNLEEFKDWFEDE